MPQFDVLKINQKHLAKVNVARSNMVIDNSKTIDNELIWSFQMWKRYITRQLKESKALTSIVVEHCYE
jgi:hypothetical protein